jgi:MFS family permease
VSDRLYNRNFALAFVANLLFIMGHTMLIHIARYITLMQGDRRDIGLISGVGTVGALILRPWLGRWIDQFGPRRTWAAGYLLFIASALGLLAISEIGPALYLLRVVGTLSVAVIFASILTYLSHTTEPIRLAEAIGSIGIGGFIGMATGPWLGDWFVGGQDRSAEDFALLFMTSAGLIALSLALLPFLQSAPPHPHAREAPFWRSIGRHWPGTILLVAMMFGVCMAVVFVFLPDFVDARGIENLGTFYVLYAGWGIVLRIVFRTLPQRLGRKRQLLIGFGFLAAGMFSFTLVDRAALLILPALLCSSGHGLAFHTMMAVAVEHFPESLRGTGASITLMMFDAGSVFGAPALGYLAYSYGYSTAFTCVGISALAILLLYRWRVGAMRAAQNN